MANVLTDNIWSIDSTGTLTGARVQIARIRWVSVGAAAGHQVVLKDTAGKTVWETTATAANYVEESSALAGRSVIGLQITTLASGTVYLYHAERD